MPAWAYAVLIIFAVILIQGVFMIKVIRERAVTGAYIEITEELYEQLQDKIQKTRFFRHDLKNHIETMNALISQCQSDAARTEYESGMKKLMSYYEDAKTMKYCRDELVNTVIQIKADYCRENDISAVFSIDDARYDQIPEMSFMAVIHNLLDNAIEASLEIEDPAERMISFEIRHDEGNVKIVSKNRYAEGKVLDFKTKKPGIGSHGIGMKVVDKIVKENSGTSRISVDDTTRTVAVEAEFRAPDRLTDTGGVL